MFAGRDSVKTLTGKEVRNDIDNKSEAIRTGRLTLKPATNHFHQQYKRPIFGTIPREVKLNFSFVAKNYFYFFPET